MNLCLLSRSDRTATRACWRWFPKAGDSLPLHTGSFKRHWWPDSLLAIHHSPRDSGLLIASLSHLCCCSVLLSSRALNTFCRSRSTRHCCLHSQPWDSFCSAVLRLMVSTSTSPSFRMAHTFCHTIFRMASDNLDLLAPGQNACPTNHGQDLAEFFLSSPHGSRWS